MKTPFAPLALLPAFLLSACSVLDPFACDTAQVTVVAGTGETLRDCRPARRPLRPLFGGSRSDDCPPQYATPHNAPSPPSCPSPSIGGSAPSWSDDSTSHPPHYPTPYSSRDDVRRNADHRTSSSYRDPHHGDITTHGHDAAGHRIDSHGHHVDARGRHTSRPDAISAGSSNRDEDSRSQAAHRTESAGHAALREDSSSKSSRDEDRSSRHESAPEPSPSPSSSSSNSSPSPTPEPAPAPAPVSTPEPSPPASESSGGKSKER